MCVFKFLTDYLQILNILITIISIVAAEIHVFRGDYSRSTLVWINVYIFVWFLYLVGVYSCKSDNLIWNYSKYISRPFARISICGIVARAVLFYYCDSSKLVQFYLFLTFNALSIRFYIPIQLSRRNYTLPYTKNGSTIVLITAILFAALLIFLFIAAGYPNRFNEIMIFQLYYSFFNASFIDYRINSTDGVEEIVEPVEQLQQLVTVLVIRERPAQPFRPYFSDVVGIHRSSRQPVPECQICLIPYNAYEIPSTLLMCGHCICQNCIGTIMSEGSIEDLPRNYASLDYAGPLLSR